MHIDFLHDLLDIAARYESEGGNTRRLDREDFLSWLFAAKNPTGNLFDHQQVRLDGLIAMHFGMMSKYVEFYARRVFRHSDIYSLDDWSVMAVLFPDLRIKKTEVMRRALVEKSSGNEILKRLLRQDFIAEVAHPDDHRSKLIYLTEKGLAAFQGVQKGIANLSTIVSGDLEATEKDILLALLLKLNRFHRAIFDEGESRVEQLLEG